MGVFAKLAGLVAVLGGGSLATLWLLFAVGSVPLAVAALVATGALTLAWIVAMVRAEQVRR